ncbi:Y-family DNA polymerase [Halorhodospira halophila]|uniref:Y-family DNA polymerase n=1 Tax=Halorhodospira halophila TaxID=1053 RepID=UPI00191290E1|nr:DNA polymerase Y family protein [Halorhodospira halophila]
MPEPHTSPLWLAVRLPALAAEPPASAGHTLEQVGLWGLELTHQVSLAPPDTVFLEVGGSQRLFGGPGEIRRHAREGLQGLGQTPAYLAAAPTPQGARLLARASPGTWVTDRRTLRHTLMPLPCQLLDPTPAQQEALDALGLSRLGDCLRMPRSGLRRRIGDPPVRRLEQALGERPEPRHCITPPQHYRGRLELPAPTTATRAAGFGLHRLLRALVGMLRGIDAGVQQATVILEYPDAPETRLTLGFLRPTRDLEYMAHIARHRLERQRLPDVAVAIRLEADQLLPYHGTSGQLFEEVGTSTEAVRTLSERLIARLGTDCVHRLAVCPDPRPERAWRRIPLEHPDQPPVATPPRPAWLLRRPQRLRSSEDRPYWGGPLHLEAGPERIESGWWDGEDVVRDYYVARAPGGSRLWVYRDHRPPYGWHLHGFFA